MTWDEMVEDVKASAISLIMSGECASAAVTTCEDPSRDYGHDYWLIMNLLDEVCEHVAYEAFDFSTNEESLDRIVPAIFNGRVNYFGDYGIADTKLCTVLRDARDVEATMRQCAFENECGHEVFECAREWCASNGLLWDEF